MKQTAQINAMLANHRTIRRACMARRSFCGTAIEDDANPLDHDHQDDGVDEIDAEGVLPDIDEAREEPRLDLEEGQGDDDGEELHGKAHGVDGVGGVEGVEQAALSRR